MASIKQAFGTVQTMTVTNLHSLANSATAGWQSAAVDNTSDLFLDALVQVVVDMANTAPANSKALFLFAAALVDDAGSAYSNPASGSEGTITLVDVTANAQNLRLVGTIPYTTQDEVIESAPMSVAQAFGGVLPPKWSLVIINHTGAALAASGNSVKWRGVYQTAA